MNAKDLTNVINFWENHTHTIEDFARKAGDLADRIHAINDSGKSTMTVATLEEAACLVAWQARTFAGEWDHNALAEIHEFMRYRVQVIYPDIPQPRIDSPDERARMVSI